MGSFKKRLIEEEEMGIFQDEQIEEEDMQTKGDWFDVHIEVIGLLDEENAELQKKIKKMCIEEFTNNPIEKTESEVVDDNQ
jgi:hypothetical protein